MLTLESMSSNLGSTNFVGNDNLLESTGLQSLWSMYREDPMNGTIHKWDSCVRGMVLIAQNSKTSCEWDFHVIETLNSAKRLSPLFEPYCTREHDSIEGDKWLAWTPPEAPAPTVNQYLEFE